MCFNWIKWLSQLNTRVLALVTLTFLSPCDCNCPSCLLNGKKNSAWEIKLLLSNFILQWPFFFKIIKKKKLYLANEIGCLASVIKAIVTKFIENINLGLYVGRFGLRDVVDVTHSHRTVSGQFPFPRFAFLLIDIYSYFM